MKRVISLLLAVIMCVSLFTVVSASETIELKDEHRALLKATGLLTDATDLNKNVTRGEFAYMLVNSIYENSLYLLGEERFADVTEDNPYFAEITLLKQLGVSKGDEYGNYNADAQITTDEAIILAVRFLGYEKYAEKKGYESVAALKELYKGTGFVNGNNVTYKGALVLMYNILNADISDQYYYDNYIYTFMNTYRKIYKVQGSVTDDGITCKNGASGLKASEIVINNIKFINKTNESNLFGYDVVGFYKSDREISIPELLAVVKKSSNQSLVLKDEVIVDFDPVTNTYIYYEDEIEKDETEKVELPFGITIIYNGVAPAMGEGFKREHYIPENGNIVLFDSDGDGNFDILFINDYDTYIVGEVRSGQQKIYCKDGKDALDIRNKNVVIEDKTGKKLSVSDIQEDDVLTVSKSFDGNVIRIFISQGTVINTVTGIDDEGNIITGAGNKSKLSNYFVNNAYEEAVKEEDRKDTDNKLLHAVGAIKLGATYIVYSDIFGRIVKLSQTASADWEVGYLINSGKSSRSTIAEEYAAKVFHPTRGMVDVDIAQKVTIYKNDLTEDRLEEKDANVFIQNYLMANSKYRVVRYKTNENEEIFQLEFPVSLDCDTSGITDRLCILADRTSTGTRNYNIHFPPYALSRETSVVFNNPETITLDEQDYSTVDIKEVTTISHENNKFIAYSLNPDEKYADYYSMTKVDKVASFGSNNFMIIQSIVETYDRNTEEITYKVKGYCSNSLQTYIVDDAEIIEKSSIIGGDETRKLSVGDAVCFSSNTKNGIKYLRKAFILYDADGINPDTGKGMFGALKGTITSAKTDTLSARGNPTAFGYGSNNVFAQEYAFDTEHRTMGLGYLYSANPTSYIITTQPLGNGAKYDSGLDSYGEYATIVYPKIYGINVVYGKTTTDGKIIVRAATEEDFKSYLVHGKECSKIFYIAYYGSLRTLYIID